MTENIVSNDYLTKHSLLNISARKDGQMKAVLDRNGYILYI